MRKILILIVSIFAFFYLPKDIYAIYDPLSVPNNRFGIHVFSEKDIEDAAVLVNSSGGEWGYVTLVITEAERDKDRWQKVFDQMRRLRLIPIVRIATKARDDVWEKPKHEEINNWIAFLDSLNWVIKNRYVVIGNEPNHAKEWGEKLSPQEYGDYLKTFSQKLKSANSDFFVLPAGFDASSLNSKQTMREERFIKEMLKKVPDSFDYIDGWTSHSYPNPGIATFGWELSLLRGLGIKKDLPVFITETGWQHKIESDEGKIGQNLTYAYQNTWRDGRIVAVTPFILDYPNFPFDIFSWKRQDGTFYSFASDFQKLEKTQGKPIQEIKGEILTLFLSPIVLAGSEVKGVILVKNLGQSIWDTREIILTEALGNFPIKGYSFEDIEPGRLGFVFFRAVTPPKPGTYNVSLVFKAADKEITNRVSSEIVVVKPPEVKSVGIFAKILNYFRRFLGR